MPAYEKRNFQMKLIENPFLQSLIDQQDACARRREKLQAARHPDLVAHEKHLETAAQLEKEVVFHRKKAAERLAGR